MPFEFDVAMSFAGEDRDLAEEIAEGLRDRRVSVFYDFDQRHKMLGKNLIDYLADMYRDKCKYCVLIISKHYAAKKWPSHERKAALERALQQKDSEYVLPVRVDDTEIAGFYNKSIAYLDASDMTTHDIIEILARKIKDDPERDDIVILREMFGGFWGISHPSKVPIRNQLAAQLGNSEEGILLYTTLGEFRLQLERRVASVLPEYFDGTSRLEFVFYEDLSGIDFLLIVDESGEKIRGVIDSEATGFVSGFYRDAFEDAVGMAEWTIASDYFSLEFNEEDLSTALINQVDIYSFSLGRVRACVASDNLPVATKFIKRQ
jgi:hypothetical protein